VGSSAIARESLHPSQAVLLTQTEGPNQSRPSPGVQQLQNRLVELGYYSGPTDGVFNAETRDALAAFQRDSGLVGTGILDPITRQRLTNPAAAADAPPGEGLIDPAAEDQVAPPNAPAGNLPTSPQPGSASTLPAVPEGVAPEDIIEAAPGSGLTEEGESEIPTPDSDSAPVNPVVPGEGTFELDGEADSVAADEVPDEALENRRGPSRILWLGLAIMAIGGIGIGLLLWLAQRHSGKNTANYPESNPDLDAGPSMQAPSPTFPVSPPSSPLSTHQGQPPTPLSAEPASLRHEQAASPLDVGPEPRMSKINIVDELIQDLSSPDPTLRHKAIWELGQRGNSAAVQPLASLLIEADSHEQGLILAALSEISVKTLKPMNRAVAIALQDENPEVRKNAIRDVTRIYDSLGQVGRMLGHATADSDPEVRQTANWALEQLNHMRFSANESAAYLQESRSPTERLPEDGSSSR
jgi:hypothetical protein